MLRPVSRDTLTRQAALTLKKFIITENLAAGARLPSERELSEVLVVSRNIVREALSSLEAEGMIVRHAGKGTFVSDFDRDSGLSSLPLTVGQGETSVQDLREARAALEIGSVGLIVQRISEAEIAALNAILTKYEEKHAAGQSAIQEDIDFHVALLEATKNSVIAEMTPIIGDVFRREMAENVSVILRSPDRIIVEHRRIVQALHERDIVSARIAMHDHFRLEDFPV